MNDDKTEEVSGKKVWETLELERMSVSIDTKAGMGRIDPTESLMFYRPS